MFGKLNHLAITSDRYTLLGMFYRAMFGLKASGDTIREVGAISVGDGYVGMTLIPRRPSSRAVAAPKPLDAPSTTPHSPSNGRQSAIGAQV